jgi:ribose transport system substrate-binding protein
LIAKSLLLKGLAGALAVLTVGAFCASFTSLRRINFSAPDNGQVMTAQFALYIPDTRNAFFESIIEGSKKAALAHKVALSVHSINPAKHELEMASLTGVDGVIVCPYLPDAEARVQLEKLKAKKIPVVIINHNIPETQPWPFIGVNNFDVGKRMGTLVKVYVPQAPAPGGLHVAIVYSDKAPDFYGERELVEMGISEALGSRLRSPIMSLKTNSSPLDAEEVLSRLFLQKGGRAVNAIIFTDSSDTIAAAQTLVDLNLVGKMQVIGFGDDPVIKDDIKKGIIACSIAIPGASIGKAAVDSLYELKTTGYTSASVNPEIEIIK